MEPGEAKLGTIRYRAVGEKLNCVKNFLLYELTNKQ